MMNFNIVLIEGSIFNGSVILKKEVRLNKFVLGLKDLCQEVKNIKNELIQDGYVKRGNGRYLKNASTKEVGVYDMIIMKII